MLEACQGEHKARQRAKVYRAQLEGVAGIVVKRDRTPFEKQRPRKPRPRKPRRAASLTHCIHGHAWTPENTSIDKDTGLRRCRACRREAWHRFASKGRAVCV